MKLILSPEAVSRLYGSRVTRVRVRATSRVARLNLAETILPSGVDCAELNLDTGDEDDLVLSMSVERDSKWSQVASANYRLLNRLAHLPDPNGPNAERVYSESTLRFTSLCFPEALTQLARTRYRLLMRQLRSSDSPPDRPHWDVRDPWRYSPPPTFGTPFSQMLSIAVQVFSWRHTLSALRDPFMPSNYQADSARIRSDFLSANTASFESICRSNPVSVAELTIYGMACVGLGRREKAERAFQSAWTLDRALCRNIKLLTRGQVRADVSRPVLEFSATELSLDFVAGEPSSAEQASPAIVRAGNVAFLRRYLMLHVSQAVAANDLHWHFHIVDDEQSVRDYRRLLKRSLDLALDCAEKTTAPVLSISSEALPSGAPVPAYYASARFIHAPRLMELLQRDIWLIDADSVFIADPARAAGALARAPVSLTAGPLVDCLLPWHSVLAYSAYFRNDSQGYDLALEAANATKMLLRRGKGWMVDQVALGYFYEQAVERGASIRLNRIADLYLDQPHTSLTRRYER